MKPHKNYAWLWIIWGIWGGGLIAWTRSASQLYAILTLCIVITLSVISIPLISLFKHNRKMYMALFKNKLKKLNKTQQSQDVTSQITDTAHSFSTMQGSDNTSKTTSNKVTFIAPTTRLTGDIQLEGDIHIDGEIEGKINTSGTITVMMNGHICGELYATTIIINGRVDGQCGADTIEILEKGKVQGTLCSNELSISKGGVFIGASECKTEGELLLVANQPKRKSNGKVTHATVHSAPAEVSNNTKVNESLHVL